jgi:hypothetical protein
MMEETIKLDESILARVTELQDLKEFAVEKGYSISERLLSDLNKFFQNKNNIDPAILDQLTIELTKITFPVTTKNVRKLLSSEGLTSFVYWLLFAGLIAAVLSGYFAWLIQKQDGGFLGGFAAPGLSLLLGVVGAIVYVMLPDGRLNLVAGLDAENVANNIVRVVLGGLLGFVLYTIGTAVAGSGAGNGKVDWTLLYPLLGGYSITLVVGVLAKVVAALQLTFNIEDKTVRTALQR